MSMNCRPGDVAIVIHDEPICVANIGRIVRIEGPLEFNEYYNRPCWLVYPISDDPFYCLCGVGVARGRVITEADCIDHPDAWLMPIKPIDTSTASAVMQQTPSVATRELALHLEDRGLVLEGSCVEWLDPMV